MGSRLAVGDEGVRSPLMGLYHFVSKQLFIRTVRSCGDFSIRMKLVTGNTGLKDFVSFRRPAEGHFGEAYLAYPSFLATRE